METATPYQIQLLLDQIAIGNEDAFRELYQLQHQRIYSFAFYLTNSVRDSEELTQDIFIKIWSNRSLLPTISNFQGWLTVVLRNHIYNHLKKKALEELAAKKIERGSNTVEDGQAVLQHRELNKLISQALEQLPPQQKKVFQLSRLEGLKQEDIARELGLSTNTVKNHLKAALRSVRRFLAGQAYIVAAAIAAHLLRP